MLSDFYKNNSILFNPAWNRTTISSKGYNWTGEYNDITLKREIPPLMYEPSIEDEEWEKFKKMGVLLKILKID